MNSVKISQAEWRVMTLLWEEAPRGVGEIVAALESTSGWRPRTTRTLLERLVRKGALKVLPGAKRRYAPALSREACVRNESRSFITRVFGGEPASLLLHLIKETKLRPQEIERLKQLLSDKEK
jgi:BlaI family penicillinase repressor